MEYLHSQDYNYLALSGGEPFLYRDLVELVQYAKNLGFLVSLTTNGTVIKDSVLIEIKPFIDLIAVSIDGKPEAHNINRNSKYAFQKMEVGVEKIRKVGIPFGFIFSLTMYNADEIEWISNFAHSKGAKMLQIHPLEEVGRANNNLLEYIPDSIELSGAIFEALRLQACIGEKVLIKVDSVSQDTVTNDLARLGILGGNDDHKDSVLSELVNPIVIRESGEVIPLTYGLSNEFMISSANSFELKSEIETWRRTGFSKFQNALESCREAILQDKTIDFCNWPGFVANHLLQKEEGVLG